jgi:hypothetical protein
MKTIITFALTIVFTIRLASCENVKRSSPHLFEIIANAQYGETHAYSEWCGRYWEVFQSKDDPNNFCASTTRISISSFDSITTLINEEYGEYLYNDKTAPAGLICDTCVLWIGTKDFTKYYYWEVNSLTIMWGLMEAKSGIGYAYLDLHFSPKLQFVYYFYKSAVSLPRLDDMPDHISSHLSGFISFSSHIIRGVIGVVEEQAYSTIAGKTYA